MGLYENTDLSYEAQKRLKIYSVLMKRETEGLHILSFTICKPTNNLKYQYMFHTDIFHH
jgi:hypothetical protein